MPAARPGRMADLNAEANGGALFPVIHAVTFGTVAAGTTVLQKIKPRAAGEISKLSMFVHALNSSASFTVDVTVRGVSILAAAQALTANTTRELENLGADASGEYRNINTDTAANRAKLRYEAGDEIVVSAAAGAGGAPTNANVELTCDEKQPRKGTVG